MTPWLVSKKRGGGGAPALHFMSLRRQGGGGMYPPHTVAVYGTDRVAGVHECGLQQRYGFGMC